MTNTISVHDRRNEDRHQAASYKNGEPQDKAVENTIWSYYGQHKLGEKIRASLTLKVNDQREVYVLVDTWGEDSLGELPPKILTDTSDVRVSAFYVDSVRFTWSREFSGDEQTKWKMSKIAVSGDNCRKDGTRGQITGGRQWPTFHEEVDGVLDESDFEHYRNTERFEREGDYPDHVKERFGKPRHINVADPLPQWLQTIVDRTHPVTGENPFTFGDEHVYGRFGAQEAVV